MQRQDRADRAERSMPEPEGVSAHRRRARCRRGGSASGLRRFRVLFVIVPRKNGKSALSAGIGLYMLCADDEFGAEVYSGATSEKQAWEVFGPARLMAQRTPALCARFGVDVNARSLVRVDDESKFETITGDPGDGQSPSCSIHDEY